MRFSRCLTLAVLSFWCCVTTPAVDGKPKERLAKFSPSDKAPKTQLEPPPAQPNSPASAKANRGNVALQPTMAKLITIAVPQSTRVNRPAGDGDTSPRSEAESPKSAAASKIKRFNSLSTMDNSPTPATNVQKKFSFSPRRAEPPVPASEAEAFNPKAEIKLSENEIDSMVQKVCWNDRLGDVVTCLKNATTQEAFRYSWPAQFLNATPKLLIKPSGSNVWAWLNPSDEYKITLRAVDRKGNTRVVTEEILVGIGYFLFKSTIQRKEFLVKQAKNIDTLAAIGFGSRGVDFVETATNKTVFEEFQIVENVMGLSAFDLFERILTAKDFAGSLIGIQEHIRKLRIVNLQLAVMKRVEALHAENYRHCNVNLENVFFNLESLTDPQPNSRKFKSIQEEIEFRSKFVTFPSNEKEAIFLLDPKNVRFLRPALLEKVENPNAFYCLYPQASNYQANDIWGAAFSSDSKLVEMAKSRGLERLINDVGRAFAPIGDRMDSKVLIKASEESKYLEMVLEQLDREKTAIEAAAKRELDEVN